MPLGRGTKIIAFRMFQTKLLCEFQVSLEWVFDSLTRVEARKVTRIAVREKIFENPYFKNVHLVKP